MCYMAINLVDLPLQDLTSYMVAPKISMFQAYETLLIALMKLA